MAQMIDNTEGPDNYIFPMTRAISQINTVAAAMISQKRLAEGGSHL